ncbi:hypothetical protein G6F37_003418 [Rhizopus arrhizus]|nr:hypothetical protein G6F38_006964 [Rhizopus arrhizus]KAG1161049.1 hypothetical protein G6F37_003418 [Rhizopus arrhizus]
MLRFIPLRQSAFLLLQRSFRPTFPLRPFSVTTTLWRKNGPVKDLGLRELLLQSFSPNKKRIVHAELKRKLGRFSKNIHVRRQASSLGIKSKLFKDISDSFVKAALAGQIPRCTAKELASGYTKEEGSDYIDRALLQAFIEFAEPYLPKEVVHKVNSLKKLSDLRFPSEWFPEARQMKRKIILHVGPTNSGKTYRALQRLESAESGIYCGPLRLLAHEIYEKMNNKGIPCNLLTGEEKREVSPHATLTSSTVEMASIGRPLDVAVIDEIQLIADPNRGWAWTQALLGLKAKEIHLCGEEAAVPLIRKICEDLDEEVVVNKYERLTPYTVSDMPLKSDLSQIEKGDCVVAFSRMNIFDLKKRIEAQTGLKCAVAYGSLPPETRALQAKSFNDPDSGIDVLVASDAVGMGLNLNIKRVVFSNIQKFDGKEVRPISIPQLKQIAGRAGRFGTAYGNGIVTALNRADLRYIKEAVAAPNVELEMAGLQPTVDMLELFALQMPNETFSGLLQKFEDLASVSGDYFLCNYKDQKLIADNLEEIRLPLRDRYQFVTAPVSTRSDGSMELIKKLARKFSQKKICTLDELIDLPTNPPTSSSGLKALEESHKQIMLYMWLSIRYPDTFITTQDDATSTKAQCEHLIDEGLKLSRASQSIRKGRKHPRPHFREDKLEFHQ